MMVERTMMFELGDTIRMEETIEELYIGDLKPIFSDTFPPHLIGAAYKGATLPLSDDIILEMANA